MEMVRESFVTPAGNSVLVQGATQRKKLIRTIHKLI
jgi:hypothetical protein